MTEHVSDGGTASWTSGGAVALATYAPDVLTSYGLLTSVRPSGVHDELLESPEVAAFAEQFRVDAAGIDEQVRGRFTQATGDHAKAVVDMVWISDVSPRIRVALDALFGPSDEWPVGAATRWRTPTSRSTASRSPWRCSTASTRTPPMRARRRWRWPTRSTRTPTAIPGSTVAAVHELLTPAQAVEIVLDAASSSADKIAVALP